MSYIDILGQKAKACKKDIAFASTTQKNDALLEIAHILRVCKDDIIEANKVDLENGRMRKMSEAMLDRLALNDSLHSLTTLWAKLFQAQQDLTA